MDSKQKVEVPTQVDAELSDYQIYNKDEKAVKFGTLFENRSSIIVFIHFVRVLGEQINFEELKKQNIDLKVVGCGKKNGIKLFGNEIKFPIEYLYTDPDRFTYNKLGMIRVDGFKGLKGDGKKSQETSSSAIGGLSWSLWKAVSRGNQGDIYQLGGCFVIDQTGKIQYDFIDHSAEGHISVQQIKDLAQKYGNQSNIAQ